MNPTMASKCGRPAEVNPKPARVPVVAMSLRGHFGAVAKQRVIVPHFPKMSTVLVFVRDTTAVFSCRSNVSGISRLTREVTSVGFA